MINALPFLSGSPVNPIHGIGQTGETGLEQSQTMENSSDNPFAKIFRDQSLTSSPLKTTLPLTVLSEEQRRVLDLDSLSGHADLSSQILSGPDMPVDFLGESVTNSAELALPIEAQPHLSPVTLLESDGEKRSKFEEFIQTSSIPYASLGIYGVSEVDEGELTKERMGPSFEGVSHEGLVSGSVFSSRVFLAGGPEADGFQTKIIINTPGLSSFPRSSALQTPLVEHGLVEKSATHRITISDRQPFLRDMGKENVSVLRPSEGEAAPEISGEAGRNIRNSLNAVSRPVQSTDMLLPRMPLLPANAPQGTLRSSASEAFQAPLPFAETPASLVGVVQSGQSRLRAVNGVSLLPGDASGYGKTSLTGGLSDLIGDDVFESTGKNTGVDFNGGQGVHHGMGGSTHSQSGFQQSSSSLTPGTSARIAEERVTDLPTPPLQRLQMDVQVSETNRIQIDVGVQQRQVYAGLLMDQATLKNLAVQFVPQLENQLTKLDMDLQEFSAEVRDHHREREPDASSHHPSGMAHTQRASTTFHHAPAVITNSVMRVEDQRLHLVA